MKVLVVGAGYAGTIAANRLAKKVTDAQITVLNPRADFVERVRLHQQVAGTGRAATPLTHMLREGIDSRVAMVEKIGDRSVRLDSNENLAYDFLFLAVGSTVSPLDGTIPVGTWEGAEQAGARLRQTPAGASVVIVGGGLTGIETAAEIAYSRPDIQVQLVGPAIGSSLSQQPRDRAQAGLERLKVEVIEAEVTEVANGAGGSDVVELSTGQQLASDLTLWAIIGAVPDLAARSGLTIDGRGRAVVDEHLRSVTDPRIFVVGDCAAVTGARPACATATPQGAHAADTLARLVSGRAPKPYSMGFTGQALSLGRRDGVVMASRRDDTPRRLYIAGRAGAAVKETINRYAKYGSRTARYGWIPGPK